MGGSLKTSLKEKNLPTFPPDALVVFRAKVKLGAKNCTTSTPYCEDTCVLGVGPEVESGPHPI